MKGLILAGGKGTRLYPLTYTSAKQLIPVANKPVLFRVIEAIREAGIVEIGIVVGDTADEIKKAVGRGQRWGAKITYIPQDAPLGLAHAVKISRDFIGDDRFVMFLGDNVIQGGISPLIAEFDTSEWNSQIVLTRVEHPEQYGVAELGDDGQIIQLIEKPQEPPSDLALVGIYMFDKTVFEAVEKIEPSWRGELEITDAIQWLLDHGHRVAHEVLVGWWIDTGKKDPLLESNRYILETLEPANLGSVDDASTIEGRVVVEDGAKIVESRVRGPAIIGRNARIERSYIGPFTSIAADCEVIDSEIDHSVVLERSRITGINGMTDSLIGHDVEVSRSGQRPLALRLMLGDHSKIDLE